MTKLSQAALDRAFAEIEAVAIAGARCPTREETSAHKDAYTHLARAERIFIEVFPHNWRVVTILTGPNAGKQTAPPPNKEWKPYLTVGRETLRRNAAGAFVPVTASPRIAAPSRQAPSAPRALTSDEVERSR